MPIVSNFPGNPGWGEIFMVYRTDSATLVNNTPIQLDATIEEIERQYTAGKNVVIYVGQKMFHQTKTGSYTMQFSRMDEGKHEYIIVSDEDVVYYVENFVNQSGGTMTGALTLSGDPTADLHAATKQYVDSELGNRAPAYSPVVAATFTEWAPATNPSNTFYLRWITASDLGKCLLLTSTETVNYVCLPSDAQENLPIGFECEIIHDATDHQYYVAGFSRGDGIAAGNAVTTGYNNVVTPKTTDPYGVAVVKKIASNTWLVKGDVTV